MFPKFWGEHFSHGSQIVKCFENRNVSTWIDIFFVRHLWCSSSSLSFVQHLWTLFVDCVWILANCEDNLRMTYCFFGYYADHNTLHSISFTDYMCIRSSTWFDIYSIFIFLCKNRAISKSELASGKFKVKALLTSKMVCSPSVKVNHVWFCVYIFRNLFKNIMSKQQYWTSKIISSF